MTKTRNILFSGKGGVGKTSISAATAVGFAEKGYRTLIVSTDAAHSLGDVLQQPLSNTPIDILPNLQAVELDVQGTINKHWDHIGDYIELFLQSQGMDPLLATEISQLPGMEELVSLLELERHQGTYDIILMDCAPTGSTVRLLAFPEAVKWYMDRFFQAERRIIKAVKPLAEKLTRLPMPEDAVFGQVEALYEKIQRAAALLQANDQTSVRLVATPDSVVMAETRRAFSLLTLHGINIDAVLFNRVFPRDQSESVLLGDWVESQQKALQDAKTDFAPASVFQIPFLAAEPVGPERLREIAVAIESSLVMEPLHCNDWMDLQMGNDNLARLRIHLPLEEKSEVRLWVDGGDLVFMFRSYSRRWSIPLALAGFDLTGADWSGDQFCVTFKRKKAAAR